MIGNLHQLEGNIKHYLTTLQGYYYMCVQPTTKLHTVQSHIIYINIIMYNYVYVTDLWDGFKLYFKTHTQHKILDKLIPWSLKKYYISIELTIGSYCCVLPQMTGEYSWVCMYELYTVCMYELYDYVCLPRAVSSLLLTVTMATRSSMPSEMTAHSITTVTFSSSVVLSTSKLTVMSVEVNTINKINYCNCCF